MVVGSPQAALHNVRSLYVAAAAAAAASETAGTVHKLNVASSPFWWSASLKPTRHALPLLLLPLLFICTDSA
jgi:hypothetical protein